MDESYKAMIIYGGPLFDGEKHVFQNGAIFVKDGKVEYVGEEETVFEHVPRDQNIEIYDTQGKVIFPGLINLHHHFYSAFAKGLAPFKPPDNFSERLQYFWWRLDKALALETVQLSALVALLDCIRHGVTLIFDHHASPNCVHDSLENIAVVVRRAGLKACLCYEISDRDGANVFKQGLDENLRFIAAHQNDASIKGTLGLHANFTLSEKSLQEIARNFDPETGLHIHCAEDPVDSQTCRQLGYHGAGDRLQHFGLLTPRTLCAHGIHLTAAERELLAQHGAPLIHNPESNMNNNVGRLSLPMVEKVKLGLGTDGMNSDMLATLRAGYLWHRQAGVAEEELFALLPPVLLQNNAEIAARFFDYHPGRLVPGAAADIVVFDYVPVTPFHRDNLFGHLIFGMAGCRAALVMTNGQRIYDDGAFLTLDEELIIEESQKAAVQLWQRYASMK